MNQQHPVIDSPLTYFGGRHDTLEDLSLLLPDDRRFARMFEPFCGSATTSLSCMARGLADAYVLSDGWELLARLWMHVRDQPRVVIDAYREAYAALAAADAFELAFAELQRRLHATVSSDAHAGGWLCFVLDHSAPPHLPLVDQSGRLHVRGARERLGDERVASFVARLERAHALLSTCSTAIHHSSFQARCAEATADDLVVLDPPYPNNAALQQSLFGCGPELSIYDNPESTASLHAQLIDGLAALGRREVPVFMHYGALIPELFEFEQLRPWLLPTAELGLRALVRRSGSAAFAYLDIVYVSQGLLLDRLPPAFAPLEHASTGSLAELVAALGA